MRTAPEPLWTTPSAVVAQSADAARASGFVYAALILAVLIVLVFAVRAGLRETRQTLPASSKRALNRVDYQHGSRMSIEELDHVAAETRALMERREAWRQHATVRGKVNFEWSPRIAQLKREGRFEEALVLTYECMDAAERADAAAGDGSSTWAGWVERACVILRKMGDFDTEVRLLERAHAQLPRRENIAYRLQRARLLAERDR